MPKALISVYDKTGLIDFARKIYSSGWELLASGGTARLIKENGLPVTEVAEYTGSPEILGGRVKTLHPAVHGGILARRIDSDQKDLSAQGWELIDMVVVNLYPFEKTIANPAATFEDAIENIDIGGVALIRAAAKNHQRVILLCDPQDYDPVLEELEKGEPSFQRRKELAIKGFSVTAAYDHAIQKYLAEESMRSLMLYPVQELRYGENPHQSARLYGYEPGRTPLGGNVLHGKELSYNNLLDLDAAWRAVTSFTETSVVLVKHLSPCGIATNQKLVKAYQAALASDPVSAFGGIMASNRPVDLEIANEMKGLFLECVIAPGYTDDALELLKGRKNLRLVEMPDLEIEPELELRSINRGILMQSVDRGDPDGTEWTVVTKRKPTEEEWADLRFAWKACQHVKSNAIVFARDRATVGIGGGQPNRVDCVRIAGERAGEKAVGAVMASDAFFPFPDSIEIAAQAGIKAVVHPGGSKRDEESIQAADAAGIAMVTTGVRHFRH